MNGCKVYQMPISVANQHSKVNTQRRVRLSVLYPTKRHVQRAIARAVLFLFKVIIAFSIAWLVSSWAIPAAYAERGYHAVGGEWLLIIAAFGLTYWAITEQLKRMIIKARKG